MTNITICALYKFCHMTNINDLKVKLRHICEQANISGTLLLAEEGINGTISGSSNGIRHVINFLHTQQNLNPIEYKLSYAKTTPFHRLKVKIKSEICTMNEPDVKPSLKTGTYVNPEEWNELIAQEDVMLIDTRNDYESDVGTFENAITPNTTNFRDFSEWSKKNLDPKKHKKVAMFCTGGIRCEKSTAHLLNEGFENVYHLKGGILNYFEKIKHNNSKFNGECFVFDNRVTVNHQLEPGSYDICHACRHPLTKEEMNAPEYIKDLSCPYCHNKQTEVQKERFAERKKQCKLAKERGEKHIGAIYDKTK